MNRIRARNVLIATIAIALVAGLAWSFRPRAQVVDVATVSAGPLVVSVSEEGRTRIRERYVVSAPVGGRLLRGMLKPGARVEMNRTVIATLEPSESEMLDPRARAQAEARLQAASAAVEQAAAALTRTAATREFTAAELRRARALFATEAISARELGGHQERATVAEAEHRSAEFQARIADYERESARALLLPPAGQALRHEVRSPVNGVVLRVFQESAGPVAVGTPLLELGDPADLEIVVELLSADAVRVPPGAPVAVEHWGGDSPLAAKVRRIEPAAFTKVSALGVEEQRVNLIADFDDPPGSRLPLGDGFRVEARVVVADRQDVIKVPIGALFRSGGAWAVYRVERGRARLCPVEVGLRNEDEVEVRSGLATSDQVVIHPTDELRSGSRVTARAAAAPP